MIYMSWDDFDACFGDIYFTVPGTIGSPEPTGSTGSGSTSTAQTMVVAATAGRAASAQAPSSEAITDAAGIGADFFSAESHAGQINHQAPRAFEPLVEDFSQMLENFVVADGTVDNLAAILSAEMDSAPALDEIFAEDELLAPVLPA